MSAMSIFLKISPNKRDEFLQTVRSLNLELRQEKGFKLSRLFQDMEDPRAFFLLEEWTTKTDMDRHLRSNRFGVLRGVLRVLSEQSEIHYDYGSRENGNEGL